MSEQDGLSQYDRERLADILAGHGTWFHADLLRLCAHADQRNLERIRRGFPETVDAYLDWRDGRSFSDLTPL